ncbi:MAG TPA: biotin--[acetyl-CoA-carboxylase] ligase [candidate division Zixibacteria bacterium]|nr:biotin--[acetyl-CoA-carboxylase] ligase [candidate division Zixibacteria bacterium]
MGAERWPGVAAPGDPLDVSSLAAGALGTRRLGRKIHYFSEISSTNAWARRLAEMGAEDGEIVIAEGQTQGRGRLGRSWVSPPFCNLYFSLVLRPRLDPAHAAQLTLTAAVAVTDSLAAFMPVTPEIKWPNDVLAGGKKLAGILTESSCRSDRVDFVVLGIGVNVNYPTEAMPEAIRERATSIMAQNGSAVSRERLAQRLIQDLDRCYGELQDSGFAGIAARWEERFWLRGRTVRAVMLEETVVGRARGIDAEGALLLEEASGTIRRVLAGDVTPVEDGAA